MRYALTVVVLLFAVSCSRRGVSPASPSVMLPASCEPVTGEVSSAAGMNVYRACEVDIQAVAPKTDGAVAFTPSQKGLRCYRAQVEFAVDTVGVPVRRTIKVLSTNDANYSAAVGGHVMSLRWKPAMLGGLPVGQMIKYDKTSGKC